MSPSSHVPNREGEGHCIPVPKHAWTSAPFLSAQILMTGLSHCNGQEIGSTMPPSFFELTAMDVCAKLLFRINYKVKLKSSKNLTTDPRKTLSTLFPPLKHCFRHMCSLRLEQDRWREWKEYFSHLIMLMYSALLHFPSCPSLQVTNVKMFWSEAATEHYAWASSTAGLIRSAYTVGSKGLEWRREYGSACAPCFPG